MRRTRASRASTTASSCAAPGSSPPATFAEDFSFKLESDFGNNSLAAKTGLSGQLTDAYISWTKIPAASLRLGQFKTPFGYEAAAARHQDLHHRAFAAQRQPDARPPDWRDGLRRPRRQARQLLGRRVQRHRHESQQQ